MPRRAVRVTITSACGFCPATAEQSFDVDRDDGPLDGWHVIYSETGASFDCCPDDYAARMA